MLLRLFLVALALLQVHAVDKASPLEYKKAKIQLTAQKQSQSADICPSNGGGLYILLDNANLNSASSLCLSVGLGLANLTFSNNFVAAQLLVKCGGGLGWISSFERVQSNTCVVLTGDGNVYFPDSASCNNQRNLVVCQDFAATLTDTVTSTYTACTTQTETDTILDVSTSTLTIVSTTTSIATGKGKCNSCQVTRTVFVPGGVTTMTIVVNSTQGMNLKALPLTQIVRQPDKELVVVESQDLEDQLKISEECPLNLPACQGDDFVLLRTYLPFRQAECACKKLGMRLADLNALNLMKATGSLVKCQQSQPYPTWVRSWEGDRYKSVCLALTSGGSINAQGNCDEGLPVLCEPLKMPAAKTFMQIEVYRNSTINQEPVYSLCSTTQSNLYVVYSQTFIANQDISAACAAFNLLPANIFDSNRAAAAAVFAVCSAGDSQAVAAQINAFDALQGSACNLIDDSQAVLVVDNSNGEVAQNCFVNQKYFVCQSGSNPSASVSTVFTGPYFFVTTTTVKEASILTKQTTITTTVSTGTTVKTTEVELVSLTLTTITSTTTTTVKITSALLPPTSTTASSPSSSTVSTSVTVKKQECPGQMPLKCPLKNGNLVLLMDRLPYSQAKCACSSHGLDLAQLTTETFTGAAELEFDCLGEYQKAWVGYEVEGGCFGLYVGGVRGDGAAALPVGCDEQIPVLCQQRQV